MVLAIGVDHPPVEVDTELPPNPLPPASGMVPAMPTQMVSVNSPGPEFATPSTVSIILRSSSLYANNCSFGHLANVFARLQSNPSLPRCSQCLHATCDDQCG